MSNQTDLNHNATVVGNRRICREHYRLTLGLPVRITASPGQFVHIGPIAEPSSGYRTRDDSAWTTDGQMVASSQAPMLRRAFSIAGLREIGDGVQIDVIYRVVGRATHWLESVQVGDRISTLGPLGNCFAIREEKPIAWLISGGVGLPPMLWLAQALSAAGRKCVAFCGAQTADLLALTLDKSAPPAVNAAHATLSAEEFTRCDVPMVVSTDDGSLGYHGHIGAGLTAYHEANPTNADEVVVYTCGPERMMRFVAEYCMTRGIECYVCMERSMACGTGTCQSCVVPVHDRADPEGWRYQLCCAEGPVFKAEAVIWEPAGAR